MNKLYKAIYTKNDFEILDRFAMLLFGRSNVGKSSLINYLLNEKVAKVSQTPGKTKAIFIYNFFDNYLIDLPGYGYAKTSNKEINTFQNLINCYLESIRNNKNYLALLLIDSKVGIQKKDLEAINYINDLNLNYIFILTKKDKANQKELSKTLKEINNFKKPYLLTSSFKKMGKEKMIELINKIKEHKNG